MELNIQIRTINVINMLISNLHLSRWHSSSACTSVPKMLHVCIPHKVECKTRIRYLSFWIGICSGQSYLSAMLCDHKIELAHCLALLQNAVEQVTDNQLLHYRWVPFSTRSKSDFSGKIMRKPVQDGTFFSASQTRIPYLRTWQM